MIAKAKPERFEDEGSEEQEVVGSGGNINSGGDGGNEGDVGAMKEEFGKKQESRDVREDDPLMHCSTDEHPEMWPAQYDGPAGPEPLVDAGELWEMFGKAADELAGVEAEFEGCGEVGNEGGGKLERYGGKTKHELDPAVVCPMCNVAGEEKNQVFYCPKCGNLLQGCCD